MAKWMVGYSICSFLFGIHPSLERHVKLPGSKTWKTFATFRDVSGLGNMEKQHGT